MARAVGGERDVEVVLFGILCSFYAFPRAIYHTHVLCVFSHPIFGAG